ncbi:hypothetical protein SISSUDRAFT_985995 [Sistotremastrum suecicum HHB10207 ss-3]|uniref:Uncharacterized protein n=1 Tax=Sistotremastrum suecicum HHB10207 ss-3 TaxID=1314776 RepID=A0A166DK65_9AGAM|nr:hypothetical protein SISSUDRAFT_985995 [Sistotremastrum suecicum HHB10207 ss-3]
MIEGGRARNRVPWKLIGGSDTDTWEDITTIRASWSEARNFCYEFVCSSLSEFSPHVEEWERWVKFGYCVASTQQAKVLHKTYSLLIHRCTFDEFCNAYSGSSLQSLMEAKGLEDLRTTCGLSRDFDEVLSQSPDRIASVWYLKAFALSTESIPNPHLLLPYGLMDIQQSTDVKELRVIYRRLFKDTAFTPMSLFNAAKTGQVFEFLTNYPNLNLGKAEKRLLRRVLKPVERIGPA